MVLFEINNSDFYHIIRNCIDKADIMSYNCFEIDNRKAYNNYYVSTVR